MKFARYLSLISIVLIVGSHSQPVSGYSADGYSYDGLEFFGSSQLTASEIEKMLHLRNGAKIERIEKATESLQKKIDKLKLFANIQIVTSPPDRAYVAFDLIEQTDDLIPTRKLSNPHHVKTKSDKPDILLEKLKERLATLSVEGRPWKETFQGGVKMYSDEPANQIVDEIRRFAPAMKKDWLSVIASDPDPDLRIKAIQLLNWSGQYADTCYRLIGAVDDSNYRVRGEAARFIYNRLDILPHDFPYEDLLHALIRQIRRPSHEDRIKSTYLMYAILNKRPLLTAMAKESSQKYVDLYAEKSKVPQLRSICEKLKAKFSQPLPQKKTRMNKANTSGF